MKHQLKLVIFLFCLTTSISAYANGLKQIKNLCQQSDLDWQTLVKLRVKAIDESNILGNTSLKVLSLTETDKIIKRYTSKITNNIKKFQLNYYCTLWGITESSVANLDPNTNLLYYYYYLTSLKLLKKAENNSFFDIESIDVYRTEIKKRFAKSKKSIIKPDQKTFIQLLKISKNKKLYYYEILEDPTDNYSVVSDFIHHKIYKSKGKCNEKDNNTYTEEIGYYQFCINKLKYGLNHILLPINQEILKKNGIEKRLDEKSKSVNSEKNISDKK